MMCKRLLQLGITLAAVSLMVPALSAQRGRGGPGSPNERFEAAGLEIGKAFPHVDVFDEQGEPHNTKSLKGFFSVVVSGCLT